MTWIQSLNAARPTILDATWDKAGPAWAGLNKERYSTEEMNVWLKLQVDILQETRQDALKSGLRKSAMQQLYFFPYDSKQYLNWLKDGLATNLFVDADVATKARELVSELER